MAKELSPGMATREEGEKEIEGKVVSLPVAIVQLLVRLLPFQPTKTDEQLSAVVAMVQGLVEIVVHFHKTLTLEGGMFHSLD